MRSRGGVVGVVVAAVLVLCLAGVALASGTWTVVSSPSPAGSGPELLAVSTDAANDAWGVGVTFIPSTSSYRTFAEHWNGTGWSLASTPNPMRNQQLNGVSAISPSDAWAVGFTSNSTWAANRTLVSHWNGTAWTAVTSPDPSPGQNDLWGAWAASSNDVWAVGEYTAGGGVEKTLAVHWNGQSWSVIPTPNPTSYANLHRVFGSSSTDVWAVGTAYGSNSVASPLTEHWNGVQWSVVSSPSLGDSYIRGGWSTSSSNAWIVGEWDGPAPTYTPHQLVYQWNGTSWNAVTSPSSANYELDGVTARSSTDAWIVGINTTSSGRRTLIEHWNGSSWGLITSPNKTGAGFDDLYATAMAPTGETWAVGDVSGGTLVEQNPQG